jgi:hypothetical protein
MVDLGPDAVTARLRSLAALSGPHVSRVDRSPDAVTARLRSLAALSALCAALAHASGKRTAGLAHASGKRRAPPADPQG